MSATVLAAIKEEILKILPDFDLVLAWGKGYAPLRTTPCHVRTEADLEKLTWGPLCVNNLASQLVRLRGKKVGIVVKGCDSRSVAELMQEGIINRDSVHIIGVPCTGTVDPSKLKREIDPERVERAAVIKGNLELTTLGGRKITLKVKDMLADKCLRCRYPNPVVYDALAADPVEPWFDGSGKDPRLEEMEAMELDERFEYWKNQMDRCIRCYACRSACPLCLCRDVCIADTREPHWTSQETSVREKWMFQMIHAVHLAGRCTECGECERACPMDIPVLTFKKHMNAVIYDLFEYEAGVDPEATPPLYTFEMKEKHIEEHEL